MSDLEKLIRDSLAKGDSSEDVAKELSRVLNAIEKEKKEEEEKAREAKKKKEEEAQDAKNSFYDELIDEFEDHWTGCAVDVTPRDAAIIALFVAMGNPANEDWTKEDMEQFLKDMTETIKMSLKIHEGHNSAEKQLNKALSMLSETIAKTDNLFGEDWGKMISDAAERTMKRARDGRLTLEEWIKKQGW